MALIVEDRILETSTTTGTGAMTLAGALTGYRAFSSVCTSPSDTCYYMIEGVDGSGVPTGEWETGLGTYSAASTLTRTTVSRSSNANAAVSFSAGTKRVSISLVATQVANLASSGTASITYGDTVSTGSTGLSGNYAFFNRIYVTNPGTIANIIYKLASTAASINAVPCVYSDVSGLPSALLAQGSQVNSGAAGVNTLPLTTPLSVAAGTYYWVGIYTANTSTISTGGGTASKYVAGSPPPATTLSSIQTSSSAICIYASGTAITLTSPTLLQEVVTTGSQASVTFSSIPATYRDLKVVVRGRGTNAATQCEVRMRFNADTAGNYDYQQVIINNTANSSSAIAGGTYMFLGYLPAASGVASAGGNAICEVPNHRGTLFHKSYNSQSGLRQTGATSGIYYAGAWGDWRNTAAITQIDIFPDAGGFVDGSVVSLYGSF